GLPDGESSYFQEDGSSARKTFLKSPLKYANVTSNFGSRFHPILKYVKSHNGVDYGAPTGTPVWAVANGLVTRASYSGAGGNTVCLRHNQGFETCYLHLHGYGPGIKVGTRVQQKQVIGYVGTTGRSTGPHLHYALKRHGKYVNPLNQNFPRPDPRPGRRRSGGHHQSAGHPPRRHGHPCPARATAPAHPPRPRASPARPPARPRPAPRGLLLGQAPAHRALVPGPVPSGAQVASGPRRLRPPPGWAATAGGSPVAVSRWAAPSIANPPWPSRWRATTLPRGG